MVVNGLEGWLMQTFEIILFLVRKKQTIKKNKFKKNFKNIL